VALGARGHNCGHTRLLPSRRVLGVVRQYLGLDLPTVGPELWRSGGGSRGRAVRFRQPGRARGIAGCGSIWVGAIAVRRQGSYAAVTTHIASRGKGGDV